MDAFLTQWTPSHTLSCTQNNPKTTRVKSCYRSLMVFTLNFPGLTNLYITSPTQEMLDDLLAARQDTDRAMLYIRAWPTVTLSGRPIPDADAFRSFLHAHRDLATSTGVDLIDNLLYYYNITDELLNELVGAVQVPPDVKLWKEFVAYDAILRAGNIAGMERALGSLYYIDCGLSRENWVWFIELDAQASNFLDMAFRYLEETQEWHADADVDIRSGKHEIMDSDPMDADADAGTGSGAGAGTANVTRPCVSMSRGERVRMEVAWFNNMTAYLDHLGIMWLQVEETMMNRLYTLHEVSAFGGVWGGWV